MATFPDLSRLNALRTTRALEPRNEAPAVPAEAPFGGWRLYLALTTILVAVPFAIGPGQITVADVLNAVAMLAFAVVVLTRRIPIALPFALPVLVIAAASLLAVTAAISVPAALIALVQDLYLYGWFVMLVALIGHPRNLRAVRWTWVVTATLVALVCILAAFVSGAVSPGSILTTGGARIAAAFSTPNMFADYLVLSIFMVLAITGSFPTWLRAGSLGLLLLALLMTKSNGGVVSLVAGLMVWAMVRLWHSGMPRVRVAGALAVLLAATIGAGWLVSESGMGGELQRTLMERTFAGRMEKSTAVRFKIWEQLQGSYAQSPLGIGPGNSMHQPVPIGARQRPDGSFISKEAHSDYLGFAVERGPIAFAALLLLTAQVWLLVARGRRRLDQWMGGSAAGSAQLACLLGALAASTVHSLVVEKLHFRHWWMFLAMAVVMTAAGPGKEGERVNPTPAAPGPRRGFDPHGEPPPGSRPGRSKHEGDAGTG